MEFRHVSVLLKKSVDGLNIKENGIYADGTLGGGGHSEEILRRLGPDRNRRENPRAFLSAIGSLLSFS